MTKENILSQESTDVITGMSKEFANGKGRASSWHRPKRQFTCQHLHCWKKKRLHKNNRNLKLVMPVDGFFCVLP